MLLAQKVEIKKECIGKSKGGLSTKIHATCDALGNPTGFHLTPGQACDLDRADVLLPESVDVPGELKITKRVVLHCVFNTKINPQ